ncbi:MAG: tetratricopeptide repeat protein [Actinomycetota bacterium]|nr:tetratricopeptide repeat protein [Actinomycetota bacterium]
MHGAEDAIAELEERLRRFPAKRYPVQHATAQFHLGVALVESGDLVRAEAALAAAAANFDPRALSVEHGKALNALGAVLRLAGRHGEALPILVRAVATFEAGGGMAEQGAALFNLGLVRREAGDLEGAANALTESRGRFEAARSPQAAAGAARELGVVHLGGGDLDAARRALEDAVELAGAAGDEALAGDAANVLGLVELAADRPQAALDAFSAAVGAHPRGVRPQGYAMAKANLALAQERAGEPTAARVSARQALGVPDAPAPVRSQAAEVFARLTRQPGLDGGPSSAGADAVALMEAEPPTRRARIVREELARWLDRDPDGLRGEAGEWIDAQLERHGTASDLAEELLAGLLELSPAEMERIIRAIVGALSARPPGDQAQFRAQVAMAAARFHVPQLLRLRDAFNAIAAEEGEPATWR